VKPNVVYLHTHDTGRYVSAYGEPVPTPRIEQLAREGLLFQRAFSAAPTCSPSRAALLTGQLPHNAGMLGLAHFGFRLTDPGQHIATTLAGAGYRTAVVGEQHVSAQEELGTLGYTDILGDTGLAPEVSRTAADFVHAHTTEHRDEPFFLSVGFSETHMMNRNGYVFGYPPADVSFPNSAPTIPSTPETRAEMGSFIASAVAADAGMGVVLDALAAAGIAEDTLVICTTDHGIAMPRMKGTLTDAGTGVMLILRGPGGFTGGRSTDALVSQIDLFPTVVELLGLDRPGWLQGVSLLPLAVDPSAVVRQQTYSEVTYHAAYEPMRAIRTERYRYLRRFSDRGRPVLPNTDDSASKRLWVEHGWADRAPPADELYDDIFDPNEMNNLAGDPRAQPVLTGLRDRLFAHMLETADPLLDGDVPAANPDRQIDPNALSPVPSRNT